MTDLETKYEHFWSVGCDSAPIDDAVLTSYERETGKKLPSGFARILQMHNGGSVRFGLHPGMNGSLDTLFSMPPDASRMARWWDTLDYMEEEEIDEPTGLGAMFPIAGNGHYYVCLDYGRAVDGEPAVTFVDLELFVPATVLGKHFDEFVTGLEYGRDDHVLSLGLRELEASARELEPLLGASFDDVREADRYRSRSLDSRTSFMQNGERPVSLRLFVNRTTVGECALEFPWAEAEDLLLEAPMRRKDLAELEQRMRDGGFAPTLVHSPPKGSLGEDED